MAKKNDTTPTSAMKKITEDEVPGFFSPENLKSLFILVLAIFAIRSTIASPYHVPTASMEPTIKVGDRLLAYKLAYKLKLPFHDYIESGMKAVGIDFTGTLIEWGTPKRGDIIVFKYPKDPDTDYVKRVVGIAGDELQIVKDILYINGKPQERVDHNDDRAVLNDIDDHKEIKLLYRENLAGLSHWVMQNIPSARHFTRSTWPRPGEAAYKVPEDSLFVIGDNRDNSKDSREWEHVPLEYVRGKALFVIWSVYTPKQSSWPSFRLTRFGDWLY
jgi:signal peptidase I